MSDTIDHTDNNKRWRLILGQDVQSILPNTFDDHFLGMDNALEMLYNSDSNRKGGLGSSAPKVNRWLKDIREYFPKSVVKVMQEDALKRYDLNKMLTQPEVLETIVPDVHLVAKLMELGSLIPESTKATARMVVKQVVEELMQKLEAPMNQAVSGAINRAVKNRRPKHNEIDWHETIKKNLKNYQADYQTIIPEVRIGHGRKRKAMKDIVLCLDQSGSMGTSVVYSGIFGAVMASIPAIMTKMVVFDTEVVDLTEDLKDPVDLLFGVQLGGGTDIHKALTYCQQITTRPAETTLVLITDLYEGGDEKQMQLKMKNIVDSGVNLITLLALNDDGAPYYDRKNAEFLGSLGVPVFACTPDLFPEMMANAISGQDLNQWMSMNNLILKNK